MDETYACSVVELLGEGEGFGKGGASDDDDIKKYIQKDLKRGAQPRNWHN